jgi:uncharacterized repeat protein (TIGR04052 family)
VGKILQFLFFLLLAACARPPQVVEIPFAVQWNGQPISCETSVDGIGLTDMRFFVSNLVLHGPDGSRWPASFEPDGIWQNESVSLIDLENGKGACLNGTAQSNASVRARYHGGEVEAISFEMSVPASLNHGDPMLAGPPLSYTPMHWHWASGYKFIRAGVEKEVDSYFLHLGSSRCEGTIGNISGCRSSNRAVVTLPDYSVESSVVVVDIGVLFDTVDLTDGQRSECMSGPANSDCRGPFGRLGLDFESGDSTSEGTVFRRGAR